MRWLAPAAGAAATACVAALLLATAATAAIKPRASLPQIEPQVMCVTCKIPLDVAQSPQAARERAFIQELIDRGEDEAQIKRAMVAQYGEAVLALPRASGFNLAAYLVPIAVVLGLLAIMLVLLPRWRRQARAQAAALATGASHHLDPADAARLESDLARFD
jgi:cytochrome c-type biogenesis protein CcmH/NrfF